MIASTLAEKMEVKKSQRASHRYGVCPIDEILSIILDEGGLSRKHCIEEKEESIRKKA